MSAAWSSKRLIQLFYVAACSAFMLCFLSTTSTTSAQPTTTLSFPQSLQEVPTYESSNQHTITKRSTSKRKINTLSGYRLANDSKLKIYYFDSTIVVAEKQKKELIGCELLTFSDEILKKLSNYGRLKEIKFNKMIKLMQRCEEVDKSNYDKGITFKPNNTDESNEYYSNSLWNLFNGLIPGTKWCGLDSIAASYSDLGDSADTDRCCRQHDFCPVHIESYQTKYNITNDSLFSNSHCRCDKMLFSCLKEVNSTTYLTTGDIFFNLGNLKCLEGKNNNYKLKEFKKDF